MTTIIRLSKVAQAVLQGAEIKDRIAQSEGVHIETVRRWVRAWTDDLTKASIVKIIKDMTGLTEDQILEEVNEGEAR